MKKLSDAAEALHGYLLREESFGKLEHIRNQLFLLANVILAATQAKKTNPWSFSVPHWGNASKRLACRSTRCSPQQSGRNQNPLRYVSATKPVGWV